jgi:redox-sensitive bicupin YhaK (pirin superfamily)
VQGVIITLDPGAVLDLPVPAADRAFVHVLDGRITAAGRPVAAGQVAWSDPVEIARAVPGAGPGPDSGTDSGTDLGTVLSLHAAADSDAPARVMVYSGPPVGEPIVLGGSFVMNDAREIEQAYRDYRSGGFGPIPRLARL